ncbi:hypothetical protein VPH35_012016 [Triticum aestivum]
MDKNRLIGDPTQPPSLHFLTFPSVSGDRCRPADEMQTFSCNLFPLCFLERCGSCLHFSNPCLCSLQGRRAIEGITLPPPSQLAQAQGHLQSACSSSKGN